MDIFRFNTIEKKFFVSSLLIAMSLSIVLTAINVSINNTFIKEEMEARGNSMANHMAKASVYYYYKKNLKGLESLVKEVIRGPEVVFAIFYDKKKKPITLTSGEPTNKTSLALYEREIKDGAGKTLGYLSLGYSKKALSESTRKGVMATGISAVVILAVITLGMIFFVRKVITRPLSEAVAVVNQLNTSLIDISAAVEQQAATSSEQSSAVSEITSTMEELSASSRQIAEHSNSVVEIASNTLDDTKKGAVEVETFITKMDEINRDNENSIKEIIELGEKSKEISKVMEIINNVADQTKLIAFNAALEASSAGESGKRFGVVAAEIRRLADNVMESTGEIENKVNEMQQAINRLVIASEKGSKGIQEGMEYSIQTAELLTNIVTGAENTTNAAKQISVSTQQQKTANDQTLIALREIDDGVRQTSDSIKQISSITSELKKLSDNLKELVEKFNVTNAEEHDLE